ncbi:hypothetical protein [Mucilaginibacter pedocola]|uniref:Uncharacterized protein n=1 Tax=Mucilaginibacter pedocola TaxID=1792845 RepID=A0A1S9P8A9_9SPHI|nr:hypothetical protein [Mucilaginibacter pedocola]OOQ57196.1 hypothetical protein BC343_16895 [Mucilaginibacter pedocola]
MDNSNKRKLITALITGLVFTFFAYYFGYIERFMPWWCELMARLLIAFTAILIFVNFIKQVIVIIKNRAALSLAYFYPLAIYISVILLPIGAWEDNLSKVKFGACYEGTQNQALMVFRADNSFELNWTGVFFANDWYMRTWQKNKDTLILKYSTMQVEAIGTKLLIDSGYLKPLDKTVPQRFKAFPMFYLGYCKGEN